MTARKPKRLRKKAGRPSVFTDEVIRKIEEVAALDGTVKEMAAYAGIHHDSIYAKMAADKAFSDRIAALKEQPVLKARRTFVGALEKPFYAVEYLRRKRRDEFSDRHEVTGAGGDFTELIKSALGPSALTHSEGTGRRSSLARMALAGFVQTKGFEVLLCSRM